MCNVNWGKNVGLDGDLYKRCGGVENNGVETVRKVRWRGTLVKFVPLLI